MAYTKEQREANAKKKSETIAKEKAKVSTKEKTAPVATKPKKKIVKLDDSVLITVKSNIFGRLTYRNTKTGDTTKWLDFGDSQELSIGDLRAMKGTQRRFFSDNWIIVDSVYDAEYEDITSEDIYKTLQVSQYYEELLCPKNINDVFNWSVDDIKLKVPNMSTGVKESLTVKANELIDSGILDSNMKIKALETVLNCELSKLE